MTRDIEREREDNRKYKGGGEALIKGERLRERKMWWGMGVGSWGNEGALSLQICKVKESNKEENLQRGRVRQLIVRNNFLIFIWSYVHDVCVYICMYIKGEMYVLTHFIPQQFLYAYLVPLLSKELNIHILYMKSFA